MTKTINTTDKLLRKLLVIHLELAGIDHTKNRKIVEGDTKEVDKILNNMPTKKIKDDAKKIDEAISLLKKILKKK